MPVSFKTNLDILTSPEEAAGVARQRGGGGAPAPPPSRHTQNTTPATEPPQSRRGSSCQRGMPCVKIVCQAGVNRNNHHPNRAAARQSPGDARGCVSSASSHESHQALAQCSITHAKVAHMSLQLLCDWIEQEVASDRSQHPLITHAAAGLEQARLLHAKLAVIPAPHLLSRFIGVMLVQSALRQLATAKKICPVAVEELFTHVITTRPAAQLVAVQGARDVQATEAQRQAAARRHLQEADGHAAFSLLQEEEDREWRDTAAAAAGIASSAWRDLPFWEDCWAKASAGLYPSQWKACGFCGVAAHGDSSGWCTTEHLDGLPPAGVAYPVMYQKYQKLMAVGDDGATHALPVSGAMPNGRPATC